eukprot:3436494-Amphidinium_carterae.1
MAGCNMSKSNHDMTRHTHHGVVRAVNRQASKARANPAMHSDEQTSTNPTNSLAHHFQGCFLPALPQLSARILEPVYLRAH